MHELLFTEYIFGGNGGEINTAKRSLSHNYTRNVSKFKHTHIYLNVKKTNSRSKHFTEIKTS